MKEVVFLGYSPSIKVNNQSGQNDKSSQGRSFELERESNQQWFVGRTALSNTIVIPYLIMELVIVIHVTFIWRDE